MVDPSSRQYKLADIRNPTLVNLRGLVPAFLFLLFGFILALVALLSNNRMDNNGSTLEM